MDSYSRELSLGKVRLLAQNDFEKVCAERAISDYKDYLESLGRKVSDDMGVFLENEVPKMSETEISKEEALAALNDPIGGSLRVLKAVGKQRDIYAKELSTGKKRLVVHNGFEEVCAEAAIADYKEYLASAGQDVPSDLSLFRA
jgi:hypothetical protein